MPGDSPLTLFSRDDAVHVYWHERHGYWLTEWQPVFCRGEKLKRAYQACLDAARSRPGAPWLADCRQMPVIDPADQDWITRWFFPAFARAGVAFQASVVPEKDVALMASRKAVAGVEGLELSCHRTRAEAEAAILAWLEKQKE